jgi:transcriptional repressor NrdR
MVLAHLREIDIVSYIRFASVYREFTDIDSFMTEIKTLNKRNRKRNRDAQSSGGGENG